MFDYIYNFFTSHPKVTIIICTWIGALFGHILSLYDKSFQGCRPFVSRIFPNKKEVFYERIDLILLPTIGCLLAYLLLDPSDIKSATFAGLTWSGTLIALLKRTDKL